VSNVTTVQSWNTVQRKYLLGLYPRCIIASKSMLATIGVVNLTTIDSSIDRMTYACCVWMGIKVPKCDRHAKWFYPRTLWQVWPRAACGCLFVFMLLARNYSIYSCIIRKVLYQLFTLKIGVRLATYTRIAWKRAWWLVQARTRARTIARHMCEQRRVCECARDGVMLICARVYDVALCGNTMRNVALGLWLVGHPCPMGYATFLCSHNHLYLKFSAGLSRNIN